MQENQYFILCDAGGGTVVSRKSLKHEKRQRSGADLFKGRRLISSQEASPSPAA
jgi:hypothetical protein